jgi:hypothetical protein
MPRHAIYQIYYSEATLAELDPGFLPLDNLANMRPDWREYWPIRRHLIEHAPEAHCFTGYFSPRFGQKTGLDSAGVHAFLDRQAPDVDVVLFSPFFDQIALYWNAFEQAFNHHPAALNTFHQAAQAMLPDARIDACTTDSRNTAFSNFFAARPRFWAEWLRLNEVLFGIAESGVGDLAAGLNAEVTYSEGAVPAKVFVMERVATLMLVAQHGWRVAVHDPLQSPMGPMFSHYRLELVCLDALKIASTARDSPAYREAYRVIRKSISDHSKAEYAKRMKRS